MANYALTITSPRSSLSVNSRPRRAYPGIEYNIRITALGGDYPYTYSISNAPSGMVVNPNTGVITWPNPIVGTYTNIQVSVNDGTNTANETFTLTVGTAGFQFIDSVNGNDSTGTGSLANPWRTLLGMYNNGAVNAITYFRAGTYLLTGLPTTTGTPADLENRVEFNQASRSVIWLGYPGETVVIDFEHDGTFCTGNQASGYVCVGVRQTPRFRFVGNAIWMDSLTFRRMFIMALHMFADAGFLGWVVRRCILENGGPGAEGSNAAMLMSARTNSTHKYGSYFGENTCRHPYFVGGPRPIDVLKTYEENLLLVADNDLSDQTIFEADGGIAIKGAHTRYEVRGNTIRNWVGAGIGGNTDGANDGEVRFNNVSVSGVDPTTGVAAMAYHIGQGPSSTGAAYVYRNTFQGGRLRVWDCDVNTGPFSFTFNVIQNGDGGQLNPFVCDGAPSFNPGSQQWSDCAGVTDPSRLTVNNNLGQSSGLVDANGKLIDPWRGFIGTHGHMLGASEPEPPVINMRYAGIRCR